MSRFRSASFQLSLEGTHCLTTLEGCVSEQVPVFQLSLEGTHCLTMSEEFSPVSASTVSIVP